MYTSLKVPLKKKYVVLPWMIFKILVSEDRRKEKKNERKRKEKNKKRRGKRKAIKIILEEEVHRAGWHGVYVSCRNLNTLAQESANRDAENHISIMMIGWWTGGSAERVGRKWLG